MIRVTLAFCALLSLGACDVATDVAGDMLADEVRTRYLEQCQGIAQNAGIASERIGAACDCSADRFQEDFDADGQLDVNPERVEEVLRVCMEDQPAVAPAS